MNAPARITGRGRSADIKTGKALEYRGTENSQRYRGRLFPCISGCSLHLCILDVVFWFFVDFVAGEAHVCHSEGGAAPIPAVCTASWRRPRNLPSAPPGFSPRHGCVRVRDSPAEGWPRSRRSWIPRSAPVLCCGGRVSRRLPWNDSFVVFGRGPSRAATKSAMNLFFRDLVVCRAEMRAGGETPVSAIRAGEGGTHSRASIRSIPPSGRTRRWRRAGRARNTCSRHRRAADSSG